MLCDSKKNCLQWAKSLATFNILNANWISKNLVKKSGLLGSFFKKTGTHNNQGWAATERHGIIRKKGTKRLKHTGNLFRKNLQLKDVCSF